MKNKRKGIVLAASILGSFAIISTGFAAWIITGGETKPAGGQITVDEVSDQRHKINLLTNDSAWDVDVTFAAPAGANSGWLQSNGDLAEDLNAKIVFTVDYYTASLTTVTVTLDSTTASFLTSDDNKYNGKTLINIAVSANSSWVITQVGTSTTYRFEVPLVISWGSAFGGDNPVNPYTYFNSSSLYSGTVENAIAALEAVYELNSHAFGVVIETTHVNAGS